MNRQTITPVEILRIKLKDKQNTIPLQISKIDGQLIYQSTNLQVIEHALN